MKKTVQPVKSNFKIRSQQTIYHHCFKADIGKFLKDLSFGQDSVRIEEVEHVHHFHSVNSMGHAQQYTTTVGGHFHKVEWTVDAATGLPVAKCGPALKKIVRNTPRGTKTSIEGMKFYNKQHDEHFEDKHSHEMLYLGTDELSAQSITAIQKQNASFVSSQEIKGTSEATIQDLD